MTNELKPVARVIPDHVRGEGVTKIVQIVEQELPAGAGVYIIPPTHRVVSVSDLYDAINSIAYSGYYGNKDADALADKLRAIIDNTAPTTP